MGSSAPTTSRRLIPPRDRSSTATTSGLVAQAQEYGGFDRFLVAFHSTSPESLLIAAYAASVTERINLMIAHRPGFTAPTVAARQLATLDHLTNGRAGVHIITGGNDQELKPGWRLPHQGRALCPHERIPRCGARHRGRSASPFDYAGQYYRFESAFSTVKPIQTPHLPVYFGGSSDAAIEVAGKHADIYALWGETHAQVRETIARVRAAAARHGREQHVRFSLSFRPILAETEEKRLGAGGGASRAHQGGAGGEGAERCGTAPKRGARRLLAAAAQGDRLDKRLYTAIAAAHRRARVTRRPLSARPIRSPMPCSTTTTSGSRPSSSAASIPWRTRFSTDAS